MGGHRLPTLADDTTSTKGVNTTHHDVGSYTVFRTSTQNPNLELILGLLGLVLRMNTGGLPFDMM